MFCSRCGFQIINDDALFCSRCGAKIAVDGTGVDFTASNSGYNNVTSDVVEKPVEKTINQYVNPLNGSAVAVAPATVAVAPVVAIHSAAPTVRRDDDDECGRILSDAEYVDMLRQRSDIFYTETSRRNLCIQFVCLILAAITGVYMNTRSVVEIAPDFFEKLPKERTAKLAKGDVSSDFLKTFPSERIAKVMKAIDEETVGADFKKKMEKEWMIKKREKEWMMRMQTFDEDSKRQVAARAGKNKGRNTVSSTASPSTSQSTLAGGSFVTDSRDGKKYRTVKIGGKTWMAENLNYQAGNSWCYGNNSSNCNKYGRLYDWKTAKTVCPSGWHLPSREEWGELAKAAGGTGRYGDEGTAGKRLKSTSGWEGNGNGIDLYGFSALPGGYRVTDGSILDAGGGGYWWTATEGGGGTAYFRGMFYVNVIVFEDSYGVSYGLSVRCFEN